MMCWVRQNSGRNETLCSRAHWEWGLYLWRGEISPLILKNKYYRLWQHIFLNQMFAVMKTQNILQGLSGFVKNPLKQNSFKGKQRFMNQAILTQRYSETGKERWAKDKDAMSIHRIIYIDIQQCMQLHIKYSVSYIYLRSIALPWHQTIELGCHVWHSFLYKGRNNIQNTHVHTVRCWHTLSTCVNMTRIVSCYRCSQFNLNAVLLCLKQLTISNNV